MTKEQMLDIIRLLSALESWSFSAGNRLPDYLQDDLTLISGKLCDEVLK